MRKLRFVGLVLACSIVVVSAHASPVNKVTKHDLAHFDKYDGSVELAFKIDMLNDYSVPLVPVVKHIHEASIILLTDGHTPLVQAKARAPTTEPFKVEKARDKLRCWM